MAVSIQIRAFFALVGLLASTVAAPLQAIPRLDLTDYPQPIAGHERWVIQLSGLLPSNPDPALSTNPADWRVQLIVGRSIKADCNKHWLIGKGLNMERLKGSDQRMLYTLPTKPRVMTTYMACSPDQTHERFLVLGSEPYLVPYNPSYPIVVDVPLGVQLRWRLWKAESSQQQAIKL